MSDNLRTRTRTTIRSRSSLRVGGRIAITLSVIGALVGCAAETGEVAGPTASALNEHTPQVPEAEVTEPESTVTPAPAQPQNPGLDQATLDDRLRQTAWANDVTTATQLIGWGANVNAPDHTQQSAYLVATSEGHHEYLRLTLRHGADVHSLDSWVGTGLIRAAERGHWPVVGELVQAGVPLDHVNRVGYQAVHEAVWMGRDDLSYHSTVRVLFAAGANFSTPSVSEGLTPLQMADRRGFAGQSAVIRALLSAPVPADPNAALREAAGAGDVTGVAVALRAGANVNAVDQAGLSALQRAREAAQPLAAQLLVALGATLPTADTATSAEPAPSHAAPLSTAGVQ